MLPTQDRFAALARSSPWRWRSLRFTAHWRGAVRAKAVRAWVRRPRSIRVEAMDGELLVADLDDNPGPAVAVVTSVGRSRRMPTISPRSPNARQPEFDVDGLVRHRPYAVDLEYDDPMYVNYHWVAMLDPVEFADGVDEETGELGTAPVSVANLGEVDHHGRPAWQADLRPTTYYDPALRVLRAVVLSGKRGPRGRSRWPHAAGSRSESAVRRRASSPPRRRHRGVRLHRGDRWLTCREWPRPVHRSRRRAHAGLSVP